MNIKLIRNAMFITVLIMVISVLGKASAHDAPFRLSQTAHNTPTHLVIKH